MQFQSYRKEILIAVNTLVGLLNLTQFVIPQISSLPTGRLPNRTVP